MGVGGLLIILKYLIKIYITVLKCPNNILIIRRSFVLTFLFFKGYSKYVPIKKLVINTIKI